LQGVRSPPLQRTKSADVGADKYDNRPHIITGSITTHAQWTVTYGAAIVGEALTKGGGAAVTLTGAAWSGIKTAVESALSAVNLPAAAKTSLRGASPAVS
jgi:hypothetical protein